MAERARGQRFPWLMTTAIGFVVGLLAAGSVCKVRYGTWAATVHAWRGDVVLSDRYDVALDPKPDAQTVAFRLTNTSSRPVRVLGAQSSCTGMMATGLPLDFAPGASRTLEVRVKPRKAATGFRESIRVFTDRSGQRSIPLTISVGPAPATERTSG